MAEGTIMFVVRNIGVLLLQLTFTHLCLTFDLEGSQTSYAAFNRWNPCLNGSLSFEFKTDPPNALLMYTDDGGKYDFFEVKLVGGIVRLRLNLGDGTVILTAGHNANDMRWHKVEVKRSNEQTTISVDGMSQSRSSKGSEFAFGGASNNNVFFGGMPIEYSATLNQLALPSVMFEPRFKGSIRNILYSNCGGPLERPSMVDFQGIRNSDEDLCDQSNPCENGGMCLSLNNGVHCDCSRTDYEGKFCKRAKTPSEATFFGAHYLSYDLSSRGDPIVSNVDEVNLQFRTRQANGLLFYTGDGADYLNIALKNGGIAVSVNLGSGVYTKDVYSSDLQPEYQRFDDNKWHHLVVKREAREIRVKVDGKEQDVGTTSGDFTLLSSNILFVGGSPNTAQLAGSLVPNNFKGCLKKVVYKADSIHLDLVDLARTDHNLINVVGDILFDKCKDLVESQPVTFTSPESFISLPAWEVEKNGSVSFQFQTIESNGVIMYNNGAESNSDFFALEILDNDLYLILDLGSGPVKVKAPARSVADGLPHHVLVSLDGQSGFFQMDGNKIEFSTPGPDDTLDLEGKLYVGGISNHRDAYLLPQEMWSGMLGFGYVGCLQDLVLNGVKIDLAHLAKEQASQGIAEYCRTMEPQCLSRPCMHKGICHEGWNRFVCDCRASGYVGPVCQQAATTLKFDGTQHMKVSLPAESLTEAEDISLRFKTIYPNGLLFVTTTSRSKDSMELTVDGGSVRFSLSLGGSTTTLVVGTNVDDGYWHTVYIKRRAREMEVRIDDQHPHREKLRVDQYIFEYSSIFLGSAQVTVDATAKSRNQKTILNFESLEVGNMMLSDENSLRTLTSFNGEMQQFVFNKNQFIEMASSGQIQNIELTATVNSQEIIKDPVTFKSKSAYIMLPQFQAYTSFTLYFQFRTTEANGLILYNDGKEQDFIAVELTKGHLYYSFSVGAGSSRIRIESPTKLNNNEWHDVAIIRPDDTQHILRVDDAPPTVHKSKETQIVHFDLSGPLYVGGVKKTLYSLLPRSVLSREGYQGCLASIDLNSQMYNLMSSSDRIVGSVAEGCQGPSVMCASDSCLNNGRCIQHWNSFSCNCDLTSYTGPSCIEKSISYRFGPGSGLITYRFPNSKYPKTTYDELALGFITQETNAVLLRIDSATSEDYLEMELVKGNIFVVYNMGNEDHPVAELFAKVSDGKYHVVRFTRTGPNSTIQVDNMLVQPKTPEGRQLNMFNDQAVIQIGGKKNKEGHIIRQFRGIMSGLVFNQMRLLDLASENDPQITIEGDVTEDMEFERHIKEDPKADVVDLVKAGWQSTEGIRPSWTTLPPPPIVKQSSLDEHQLYVASGSGSGISPMHPGFEDMEIEMDTSGKEPGRGLGSGNGPMLPGLEGLGSEHVKPDRGSGSGSGVMLPGFEDMENEGVKPDRGSGSGNGPVLPGLEDLENEHVRPERGSASGNEPMLPGLEDMENEHVKADRGSGRGNGLMMPELEDMENEHMKPDQGSGSDNSLALPGLEDMENENVKADRGPGSGSGPMLPEFEDAENEHVKPDQGSGIGSGQMLPGFEDIEGPLFEGNISGLHSNLSNPENSQVEKSPENDSIHNEDNGKFEDQLLFKRKEKEYSEVHASSVLTVKTTVSKESSTHSIYKDIPGFFDMEVMQLKNKLSERIIEVGSQPNLVDTSDDLDDDLEEKEVLSGSGSGFHSSVKETVSKNTFSKPNVQFTITPSHSKSIQSRNLEESQKMMSQGQKVSAEKDNNVISWRDVVENMNNITNLKVNDPSGPEFEDLLKQYDQGSVKHTTPRQDVTDEIIFAGEGSGCHSDDEDDCTDVVSGHEDDIITPTVIIRTTPKPKTTTTTTSKHGLCDDEDSCDGSGGDDQPTRKPPTRKPAKNHGKPSRKPSTKGSTHGTTRRPKEDVTVRSGLSNITVSLDGLSDGENGNGPTERPIKTEKNMERVNVGLIVGIVAGVAIALLILIYALYKFRSRDEGSYKVDETQNFAYVSEPKKAPSTNGGLKPNNNCAPGKTGKKRDVKEWYV